MFASLRRWTGAEIPDQAPGIEVTVGAVEAAGVDIGRLSAWSAPHQPPLPGAGARARPARHLLARQ